MRRHPHTFGFEEVRRRERAEVLVRRRAAGLARGEDDPEEVSRTLVGLSFSGGGIRSASFNLGLLQALYRHGLLRYIDLLSTVSGGSYVSARLVSEVGHPETRLDWEGDGVAPSPAPAAVPEEGPAGSAEGPDRDAEAPGPAGAGAAGADRRARARARGRRGRSSDPPPAGDPPAPRPSAFALAPEATGRQSPEVLRMIRGGRYLRHEALAGLNRWLIGIVLIGVVAFSGVLCLGSLAALLFRTLDNYWVVDWLYVLGFPSDVHRALFPTCVLFSGWMLVWAIGYWRRGEHVTGLSARPLLVLTIASLLLAVSALLGTGDIDVNYLRNLFGIRPPEQRISQVQGWLQYLLPALLVILLLPYLRPGELIRSGTHPRNAAETWIFAIASRALLYGIPLLIFAWLARENLSKFNETRSSRVAYLNGIDLPAQSDLIWMDFEDWRAAWRSLEAEAKAAGRAGAPTSPLAAPPAAEGDARDGSPGAIASRRPLSRELWSIANEEISEDRLRALLGPHFSVVERDRREGRIDSLGSLLRVSMHCDEQNARLDRELSFPRRWLLLIGRLVEGRNALTDQHSYRVASRVLGQEVCRRLNDRVLRDPGLYRLAPAPGAVPGAAPGLAGRLAALRAEGEDLEAVADGLPAFGAWKADRDELLRVLTEDRRGPRGRAELERDLAAVAPAFPAEGDRRASARTNRWIAQLDPDVRDLDANLAALNRGLLHAAYPDLLKAPSTVFAYNVQPADQRARLAWFAWSLGLFLASSLLVNLNATSMHGYYRDQLASMWIRRRPGEGREMPLVRLETTGKGAPYPIFGATFSQLRSDQTRAKSPEDTFIFSPRFCGALRTGFVPTEEFQGGGYDLANAMAISGAALSPAYPTNPLVAVLLLLTNMRLGQWVPNPAYRGLPLPLHALAERLPASPLRLLMDALSRPRDRYYCFVADGGYVENLGLEQLLLRRCRLIIASDISSDPHCLFGQFMEVARRVRTEHGITIRGFDDDPRTPDPEGLRCLVPDRSAQLAGSEATVRHYARAHFAVAEIHYPPGASPDGPGRSPGDAEGPMTGWLILVKPSFTLDEGVELLSFWAEHPEFPNDPTTDQFYAADKFEAYRMLGVHIGEQLARSLDGGPSELPPDSRAMLRALRPVVLPGWSDPIPERPAARPRRTPAAPPPADGGPPADLAASPDPSGPGRSRLRPPGAAPWRHPAN